MADNQSPELFGQTPWQTVGPFFHYALPWWGGADLTGQSEIGAAPERLVGEHPALNHSALSHSTGRTMPPGEPIDIVGRVLDGAGAIVTDALIEIWQADAEGRYGGDFAGFGRAPTDESGAFHFRTIRPGPVPGPGNSLQAPHIALGVLGRGLLKRLVTRLYFSDSPQNETDPILDLVPAARRSTLIAQRDGDVWRFDIVLSGANETVFFDC
jgi:protocatechuate 3,4-dioxygenase alpha subunit